MYLLFALILGIIAFLTSPAHSVMDTPFAQLTLGMIFNSLFHLGLILGSIALFGKSLANDRIWPWRWTWPYFGNLMIRTAIIVGCIYVGNLFLEAKRMSPIWEIGIMIVAALIILVIMFSSEFEFFDEDKNKKVKSATADDIG
jgi:hypothetical protein